MGSVTSPCTGEITRLPVRGIQATSARVVANENNVMSGAARGQGMFGLELGREVVSPVQRGEIISQLPASQFEIVF